jgi:hypothetical protein
LSGLEKSAATAWAGFTRLDRGDADDQDAGAQKTRLVVAGHEEMISAMSLSMAFTPLQGVVAWNTLSVRLQYVSKELMSNSGYGLALLQACTEVECATHVVEQHYELPSDYKNTTCSATLHLSCCARLADANKLLAA